METKAAPKRKSPRAEKSLPTLNKSCSLEGYYAKLLVKETGKRQKLITSRA
jgi:hypothetical protein